MIKIDLHDAKIYLKALKQIWHLQGIYAQTDWNKYIKELEAKIKKEEGEWPKKNWLNLCHTYDTWL